MRRRLDLAASLIAQPPLIFLDEPTTGLDPRTRAQMWDTIRRLVSTGSTVLLTTQYLDEADQLADRIAVIDSGRVVAEGTAERAQGLGRRVDPAAQARRSGGCRRRAARNRQRPRRRGHRRLRARTHHRADDQPGSRSPTCSSPSARRASVWPRCRCRSRRSTRYSSPSPVTASKTSNRSRQRCQSQKGSAHDHHNHHPAARPGNLHNLRQLRADRRATRSPWPTAAC